MPSSRAFVPGFRLHRSGESIDEIDHLAERLGGRVDLDVLLGDLNRQARPSRWALGRAVDRAFRWERSDTMTKRWWPQGVTTPVGSGPAGTPERRIAVVSWYSKQVDGLHKGVRLTFVDLDTLAYRHVLLVVPVRGADGTVHCEPLKVHAGGIAWAGPYLHVAATGRGFMTCRIDDLLRVPDDVGTRDRDRLNLGARAVDEPVSTFGYRYLLPVRSTHRARADEGLSGLRYSFLSIDRSGTTPALVAGEYGRGKASTRLVRFPIDPDTMQLVAGAEGSSSPVLLTDAAVQRMQGAAVVDDTVHVTVSNGPFLPGDVHVGRFAGAVLSGQRFRWAAPVGVEDLAFSPDTQEFFSVTEHPLRRWVFTMRRSWFSDRMR